MLSFYKIITQKMNSFCEQLMRLFLCVMEGVSIIFLGHFNIFQIITVVFPILVLNEDINSKEKMSYSPHLPLLCFYNIFSPLFLCLHLHKCSFLHWESCKSDYERYEASDINPLPCSFHPTTVFCCSS